MVEVISHNAPMLSLRIVHEQADVRIDVFGVLKIDDLLLQTLEGSVKRYGLADGLCSWSHLRSVSVLSMVENKPVGVSIRDLAIAYDIDKHDVSQWVKDFIDSKKVKAKPIGKSRGANLYHLSEILKDFQKKFSVSPSKTKRIHDILKSKEREPE